MDIVVHDNDGKVEILGLGTCLYAQIRTVRDVTKIALTRIAITGQCQLRIGFSHQNSNNQ